MLFKTLICLSVTCVAFAQEKDVSKLSEAMGHLIGKGLQSQGLDLDVEALVKGLKDEASGKTSPLDEEECLVAINALQEETLAKMAAQNLLNANEFLKKNRERKEVKILEEGKLQYEVVSPGKGETVEAYNSPLVRLSGKFSNGESIGSMEEIISLDSAILGFSKGLVGMKEGEKRTLYIHPDLAYGTESAFPPNSLFIVEVEILKADASLDAHEASERDAVIPVSKLKKEEPSEIR